MSYLHYLCLLAHSGVQHILFYVGVFLRLVYPMLPSFLDCPFLIECNAYPTVLFRRIY
jgi:hypothetical protein